MKEKRPSAINRRRFIGTSAVLTTGLITAPYLNFGRMNVERPMTRSFGCLDFDVTTLGLGGQAAIQWTPPDVDPVKIILKAYLNGVNYFDTSNLYGPSQLNFGKAFRQLGLVPGLAGYHETKRREIFLTSKTHLRYAKGGDEVKGVGNWTNGSDGSHTIDDLKRTLSQVFGDGKGNYPKGAYLDMVLMHSLSRWAEVDALYEGYAHPDAKAERIGALAALRDYRDGTNLTGLNPGEERLVRHIGFSGHHDAPLMMEMIQRDTQMLLEGMLVSINSNDNLYLNMQHNVIPVAAARNMGIIAMKVFADGAMYSKKADWTRSAEEVVRSVGSKSLPSRPLVQYALSTQGVHTAIIGIGQISDFESRCQLTQNLSAAQVAPQSLPETDRVFVEELTSKVKAGRTNYFQKEAVPLSAARNAHIARQKEDAMVRKTLQWDSAIAGDAPISHYEILIGGKVVGTVPHQPQTSRDPFAYELTTVETKEGRIQIRTVDKRNRSAIAPVHQVKGG